MNHIPFSSLQQHVEAAGLSLVAVAGPAALESEVERLTSWQEAGYAGEMEYMRRSPELLTSPKKLFETLRSIVVVGAYYDRGPRGVLQPGYGRVARYAWGRDYHKVLRAKLRQLVAGVQKEIGRDISHRIFSDSVPLLERALASQAGLGFVGKNTMVILPGAGSFMFLGEVLWELDVTGLPDRVERVHRSLEPSLQHGKSRCGECNQCLGSCPTGAFVSEYVLDARRCISYLTIEKRGTLSLQERSWIGEWIFGCDVCQEVCPFNLVPLKRKSPPDLPEFAALAGGGGLVALEDILRIRTDEAFVRRFAGTPLMRAKREGLVRNAAVVAANTKASGLLPALREVVLEDSSPVARRHALWSFVTLGSSEGSAAGRASDLLLERCASDPDAGVRHEATVCRGLT